VAADLKLRPRISDGVLVDDMGEVTGINTPMAPPGTGMAVPHETASHFLEPARGSRIMRATPGR